MTHTGPPTPRTIPPRVRFDTDPAFGPGGDELLLLVAREASRTGREHSDPDAVYSFDRRKHG